MKTDICKDCFECPNDNCNVVNKIHISGQERKKKKNDPYKSCASCLAVIIGLGGATVFIVFIIYLIVQLVRFLF